ncbi:alcohol dehydrogenase [Maritalea myrionectae]|uniref:Alcohol dehydrogenase n=1 Tax=Maritalea myrionectae TaxID=454601 RepID=A0A2R4MBA8_9HYPH|nr:NAD(P)-dependent alcohol dehydrogenase [Maritalea myrionectae]AVX03328.1 alcohol dehydrogenase [Maritalea myrionectae]
MKAYICEKYGSTDQLHLQDAEMPTPKADEILVKVHATSLNSWDWDKLRGHIFTRIESPGRPQDRILGGDVSGVVAEVGSEVAEFAVGDHVFGDLSQSGWGAFAEYATGKAAFFAKMPPALSFEEAATLPQAGLLALQSIRDEGNVQPCMHVLVNGGGGGAGMFCIQLAKHFGATVHAVDKAEKLDAMRAFGADHVYDFRETDFTKLEQKFDVVVDAVANRGPNACFRALKSHGKYVVMGGTSFSLLRLFLASRRKRDDGKKISILMWQVNPEDMTILAEMVCAKQIKCFIEHIYPFEQLRGAMAAQSKQAAQGKHVVHIEPERDGSSPYPQSK